MDPRDYGESENLKLIQRGEQYDTKTHSTKHHNPTCTIHRTNTIEMTCCEGTQQLVGFTAKILLNKKFYYFQKTYFKY
jgi:hypothetical protein